MNTAPATPLAIRWTRESFLTVASSAPNPSAMIPERTRSGSVEPRAKRPGKLHPPGAPERQWNREPEEEPEERRAEGEGEDHAQQEGARHASGRHGGPKPFAQALAESSPEADHAQHAEAREDHEGPEELSRHHDDGHRRRLELKARRKNEETDDAVGRDLPRRVGEGRSECRSPRGLPGRVRESPQVRRELAGGRGRDQPEEDGTGRSQIEPFSPVPQREDEPLAHRAEPRIPGQN